MVLAPGGGAVRNTIALQYNPDTLTRSYQVQGVGGDGGGERAQPFRLKGPAIETIKLDAEIDATDQLEFPDSHANAVAFGIAPQLALLEALVNPSVDELLAVAAQTAERHAGNPAAGSAAGAVRLEQEPRRAGARHRLLRSPRRRSTHRSIRSAPRSASACA